ncbi:membrane protein insertion efficiency factor YidD [Candidatus Dependentiae bacterium]|nr:MAG: membrane protein insertion efficiency factor YidD [Candidatus Dependentiae bacterium]
MLKIGKFLIKSLILFFRPWLGFRAGKNGPSLCLYPISCTEYALAILEQKTFFWALYLIIKRVLLCNPIGAWFLYR